MASIYQRKNKDGTKVWRAVIRIKGHPSVSNHFERKQEAQDWATQVERDIRLGQFKFDQYNKLQTFDELVDRFLQDGSLEHHKSQQDTLRHINYWKIIFSGYALVHITTELISKERKIFSETLSSKGKKRSPATTNRYFASLSALLSYAVRELNWLSENPCFNLRKLKENSGRDRVLTEEEINRLLQSCTESKSPYLYTIVLIALTTGARQSEILNLEWKHIDLENHLAFVKESKNGKPRSLPLAESVVELLKNIPRHPYKSLVFASKTAFGKIDIKKAWQQALIRAEINDCRFHDLRHTFCTMAAAQGASNLELASATGHRTLQMLMRYTHLDAQNTKKFTNHISQKILPGDNQ